MRLLLLALLIVLAGCGKSASHPAEPDALSRVKERAVTISAWAPVCPSTGAPTKEALSDDISVKGTCDNGDMVLFNGLLCLSDAKAFPKACDFVKASVAPDGRPTREPRLAKEPEAPNAFSRDMFIGLAAYALAKNDGDTLKRVLDWTRAQGGVLCTKATDKRCEMTSNMWVLAYHVGKRIGVSVPEGNTIGSDAALLASAKFAEKGFPLHLVAAQLFVLVQARGRSDGLYDNAARVLVERQPDNPLFRVLIGDNAAAAELWLAQAPSEEPKKKHQWSVERETAEEAWLDSMGWEFLMLSALLTQ